MRITTKVLSSSALALLLLTSSGLAQAGTVTSSPDSSKELRSSALIHVPSTEASDAEQSISAYQEEVEELYAEGDIIAFSPTAPEGSKFFAGGVASDLDSLHHDSSTSTTPESNLYLNPIKIGLCNAGRENTVVYTIRNSKHNGNIDLKCGNKDNGYVHIRSRHEGDWNNAKGGFAGYWDDFMLYSTINALQAPSYSRQQNSTTRCYVTPIQVFKKVNRKPVYQKTIYPRVAVSTNNRKVITSFPTGNKTC